MKRIDPKNFKIDRFSLKDDISDLEQKTHHLSCLLDSLWHLAAEDGRLLDHEVALLLVD